MQPKKLILPVQPQSKEGYFDALIGNVLGGKKSKWQTKDVIIVLQHFICDLSDNHFIMYKQ